MIVVCAASIFRVTSPVVPPPLNPVPAVTDVISPPPPLLTVCQEQVPSPSALKYLVVPVIPVDTILTPSISILSVPSKEEPPIVLAVSNEVAVAEFPVQEPLLPEQLPVTFPVISPEKLVAVNSPLLELKVRLLPDLGGRLPVEAVVNNGKQVVSDDSSAIVTLVAVVAVSAFPVSGPTKLSDVTTPSK